MAGLLTDEEREALEKRLADLDESEMGSMSMFMQLRSDPALVLRAADAVEAIKALAKAVQDKEVPEDKDRSPEVVKAIGKLGAFGDIGESIKPIELAIKAIGKQWPVEELRSIAKAIALSGKTDVEAVAMLCKAIGSVELKAPSYDRVEKAVKETNGLLRELIATLRAPKEFETNRQGEITGLKLVGYDA